MREKISIKLLKNDKLMVFTKISELFHLILLNSLLNLITSLCTISLQLKKEKN